MNTLSKMWVIAFRDLGRNRRRTLLTLLAVALGLMLLIFFSGYIAGMVKGVVENGIRLKTGHIQVRAESYEEAKLSLQWSDLIQAPAAVAENTALLPEVKLATPVLWAGGILSTLQESSSLQISGIDPSSPFFQPIRDGMVEGQYLDPLERGQILIGQRLARLMAIGVGSRVSLIVGQSEGDPVEGIFTVSGIYATGVPTYDENTVFMTLSQAQAFTGAGDRASSILILLNRDEDSDKIAAALSGNGFKTTTWAELNAMLMDTLEAGMSFYYLIYGIVILVVAVILTNTLLMSVFERTREIGILSALGMKAQQIRVMILLEAAILALIGILIGLVLGWGIVAYIARVGIPLGEAAASVATDITLSTHVYTSFVPVEAFWLSVGMLVINLLAALYPARYASRLEPVKALHAL